MQKVYLSHSDIDKACREISLQIIRECGELPCVYAVPRGGIAVAYLLHKYIPGMMIVASPDLADIIVDDLIDSGATAEKYKGKPFYVLYNKKENTELGWLVFPWEETAENSIEDSVLRQLQFIGEDTNREGLQETPSRVIKSWDRLYGGYNQKVEDILKTFASDGYDEIVLLKDIEFYSTCEHHLLPFFGKCHIAYLPNKKVIGISKLARLMEIYSRRLQIQERIGDQITKALMDELKAKGAACIIEAQHFCMRARGIEKQNSIMITSSMKGVFMDNPPARNELMGLIKR